MFNNTPSLAMASIIAVGIALSACTTIERERSSAPPTVVMQPAQQPAAAVIVR
jgi:hypothetical protein